MAAQLTGGSVDAPATAEQQREAYIAALLREREGLLARGALSRVEAVDAELIRCGFEFVERGAEERPAAERAVSGKRR
jgi:hypothetical protein